MHALAAVQLEVRSHDSTSGCKYLREFTESFQLYDSVLLQEQLERRAVAGDLLLIGDYHALPASQKFAAELLEKCARERPVVLAVEAVLARDQQILDAWWRREISEDELRRRLRFDRDWGYSWEPFYKLLSSARDCAEGVYGLDCRPREDLRRIRSRDRHAAAKIREIRERHARALIMVVFGESHMAPQHLPKVLRELLPNDTRLVLLQNVDALYLQAAAEQALGGECAAVSMGNDAVCVFNASPLEKYESYRLCLERWRAENDGHRDFAPAIYNLIFALARSLGFRLDSPRNGTQPKFLSDSLPEVTTLTEDTETDADEKSCQYLPETNSIVIREFQVAEAAEECTRFLHFACRGMTETCAAGKPVVEALAWFGARLMAPEIARRDRNDLGQGLYQAYLSGSISRAELREIFLAHLESNAEAERALSLITQQIRL